MEHDICRELLKQTMKDVRKNIPKAIIKESWAYKYNDRTVEFHINRCEAAPKGFYWYGTGCCLWSAKASGWSDYLNKLDIKEKGDE